MTDQHFVTGNTINPPFPQHLEHVIFGLGCYWGAERKFWQQTGVFSTAVGFIGGEVKNPSYKDVCTGTTGHNEAVLVVFDPAIVSYQQLLCIFWESHNPTQGMRQGNDRGTQYRSGIYTFDDKQQAYAEASKQSYQQHLDRAEFGQITTEVISAPAFYYAEEAHQQYLAKNPEGYCGLGGVGVRFVNE
ncbi:MAG: peptide-methionine (S)-S-oxide reductase MsrA [Methylococcales bacterium]|nr:peptide-methionine (S)-S-oxide reductase MsrA [Methylococcales bacterium]